MHNTLSAVKPSFFLVCGATVSLRRLSGPCSSSALQTQDGRHSSDIIFCSLVQRDQQAFGAGRGAML